MKLETLNDKQIRLMETVRQEWLDRLFGERKEVDRKKAMELIHWLYEFCNLKKPLVIFVDSPAAMQIAANILNGSQVESQVENQVWNQVGSQVESQVRNQVESQVGSQVWNQVGSQVENQVESQVGSQVWNQVGSQVWSQVGSQVRNQVENQVGSQVESQVESQVVSQVESQVRNQVWNQVWSQVWNQVESQVENQVRNQVRSQKLEYYSFSTYGNIWDFGWLSFYDFFDRLGLDLIKNDNFHRFKELIQANIYDMIQLDKYCIVGALPNKIFRNDKNRLHSETEAAISWKDGYYQHYLEGIYFEKDIWEKIVTNQTAKEDWMNEQNLEKRRIIQEYMKERFATEIGGKVVGKHKDKRIGEIIEIDISPDPEKIAHYLHAKDWSTERMYFLRIPPTITDPMEAQAWTYSNNDNELTKKDFALFHQRVINREAYRT